MANCGMVELEGIGAAGGPRKNIYGSTGVSLDPKTNSGMYRGRPRAPEYWGVP